jgi:hypothetical protein
MSHLTGDSNGSIETYSMFDSALSTDGCTLSAKDQPRQVSLIGASTRDMMMLI